ncbi:3-keto-disaccharide hydrolase [Planctomicrobium sp. SH527]|uniref:3-keto-disaccharide hydrolase n=1 Tax=Planctomicrobium sp. SH527 TaxID=3448123 RepID=UPI003F5B72FA
MRVFATLLLTCCMAACLVPSAKANDGFVEIFNGKDLTNWDGNPELWSVKDGVITGVSDGSIKANQFLVWTGGKVSDFTLVADFRLEGNNNSGIQYRSQRRPDVGDWVVRGYQADIHANAPYTGMLYEEGGRGIMAERGQKVLYKADGNKEVTKLDVPVTPIELAEWHELKIVCQGDHITHYIDGVKTIEIIDQQSAARSLEGVLALQLHAGPPMKTQFRNIKLLVKKEANTSTAPGQPAESRAAGTK